MTKNQALGIITSAAQIYEEQFCNKNLLIVFGSPSHPQFIFTKGEPKNFYHLTGVEINKQNILRDISDKSTNPITVFYKKAINKMLAPDDFSFKNSNTEQKLKVINQTLRISSNAVMVGDYNNCRINLKSDKLAGGQVSFLGLVNDKGYYVPNTIISDDIRKNSNNTERVLAVLSKKINEREYNKIEKVAKKIDIDRLIDTLKNDVSISSELISKTTASISAPQNNVNIVSFSRIDGTSNVLAAPRFSIRQALANLINSWAEKIKEGIRKHRRELHSAKKENSELKRTLSERDEQLVQKDEQLAQKDAQLNAKDDEIAALKKQNAALTVEMYEQNKLIREAFPPKTFSQKMEEAKNKCRERNAENQSRSQPSTRNRRR